MRTTIDTDPDVLQTAKEFARKEKKTADYATKTCVPALPATGSLVSEETTRKIRDTVKTARVY